MHSKSRDHKEQAIPHFSSKKTQEKIADKYPATPRKAKYVKQQSIAAIIEAATHRGTNSASLRNRRAESREDSIRDARLILHKK